MLAAVLEFVLQALIEGLGTGLFEGLVRGLWWLVSRPFVWVRRVCRGGA